MVHVNAESSLEAHWRMERLAKDFPQLTFLAHDGLWSYERARHILETAGDTPNVIWDFGGLVHYLGVGEWVERNGAESICFSAGLAYAGLTLERPRMLNMVQQAAITDGDKQPILGGNLQRLFSVG